MNARLVAERGFAALYMTGAGTTAVRLGMPDIGLLTMTEMVDNAARIVDASGLPLIADADNGYGGRSMCAAPSANTSAPAPPPCIWRTRCCPSGAGTLPASS